MDPEMSKNDNIVSPIQKLNQDCLISILSKLPMADLVRCERVCQNWREVSLQSWSAFRKLFLTPEYLGLRPIGTRHTYKDITENVLEQVLKRCGRFLQEFRSRRTKFDASLLIAEYCKNIQSIKIPVMSIARMEKLGKNCTKISELDFDVYKQCNQKFDEALGNLFLNNNKLRSFNLSIDSQYELSSDCILKLPLHQMTTIDISLTKENLRIISKYAKNLRNLDYYGNDLKDLEIISSNLSNLTELRLNFDECYEGDPDLLLSQVFKSNRQLKIIHLGSFRYMTGECFVDLDKNTVEEIEITHAESILGDELIKSWPYFENFRKLRFIEYDGEDFLKISECLSLCANFKEFAISFNEHCEDKTLENAEVFIKCFASSKSLEILYFDADIEMDKFCDFIGKNLLELRCLYLGSECVTITSSSIQSLSYLKKLREFDLEIVFSRKKEIPDFESVGKLTNLEVLDFNCYIDKFTGSELENLTNLRKLYCPGSLNLKEINIINLVKRAPNLELLDIAGCKKITNSLIDVAIEVTKNRTNNILLQINIYGTSIDINKIREHSPLLYLNDES